MKKLIVLLVVLLVFASFVLAKSLEIGAKNYTEQYILGSLVSQLLEANGFDVDENFGMSTFAVRSGLETGQIDMYPDYTGTAWTTYLGHEEVISDPDELYELVKAEDYERNNVIWLDRINFNNTYAIAVRDEFAAEHGLKTLSDLAEYLNNTDERHIMGIDFEFYERPDGFFAMAEKYGMDIISSHARAKFDVKDVEGSLAAWGTIFDDHKAMGCKYVIFPMNQWADNVEQMKVECDLMNKIGAEANLRGIKFGYHNHNMEFENILFNKNKKTYKEINASVYDFEFNYKYNGDWSCF